MNSNENNTPWIPILIISMVIVVLTSGVIFCIEWIRYSVKEKKEKIVHEESLRMEQNRQNQIKLMEEEVVKANKAYQTYLEETRKKELDEINAKKAYLKLFTKTTLEFKVVSFDSNNGVIVVPCNSIGQKDWSEVYYLEGLTGVLSDGHYKLDLLIRKRSPFRYTSLLGDTKVISAWQVYEP